MIDTYGAFGAGYGADWLDVQRFFTKGGAAGVAARAPRTSAAASTDATELYRRASAMIEAAESGRMLDDYRKAEGSDYFFYASANDTGAYLRSAYWLAVAVRVGADSSLLSDAKWNLRKGYTLFSLPGGSVFTSGARTIPKAAAKKIIAAGGGVMPGVAAVASILDGSTGGVATRQWQTSEQGAATAATEAGKAAYRTGTDLAKLTTDPWAVLKKLPWYSWVILGAVVLMPVVAVLVQGGTVRRLAARALPGPAKANPRRRRRNRRGGRR